jgi:hypothetical protein
VQAFGVPAVLAAPVAVLLPAAELAVAVAVAVLPGVPAWWGALGALVLLLLFAAGIVVNLARGTTRTVIVLASCIRPLRAG